MIDDNPQGSLEAVLLTPLVIASPLAADISDEDKADAVKTNLLNKYLPLDRGELYAVEAEVDFQVLDFETRRQRCKPRFPIVEVERDFVKAWHLVTELAENPPDIIFHDVMFELKTTDERDIEAIIAEIQRSQPYDRIGQFGPPTMIDFLNRGGLFLLGKLLRTRDVRQLPLIVLYSASRDVHNDFRPFEYASDGRFEVVDKEALRTNAERRNLVFRRRIRDYLIDGTVRADEVRGAVALLGTRKAINGDHQTLVNAFSRPIGSGWCFGAMFAAESVAYLSNEAHHRRSIVEELEKFIAPLISDARSFVDLMENSPARLFTHEPSMITFPRRPSWLDPELGETLNGDGKVSVSLDSFNGDLTDILGELELAVTRLPGSLRNALDNALDETLAVRQKTRPGENAVKRRRDSRLDRLVRSLAGYDLRFEDLIDRCRMRMPAATISTYLNQNVIPSLRIEHAPTETALGKWEHDQKLQLFLSPTDSLVKEPLASLLKAILSAAYKHGYHKEDGRIRVDYAALKSPAALQLTIRDYGSGFTDLRYYDPHGRGGDLSTALVRAAEWFEIEIESGGIKRRSAIRGAGVVEESSIEDGTQFTVRVPAYSLEA